MFSLQRLLGDDRRFACLLEASADEACQSVVMLQRLVTEGDGSPSPSDFVDARRRSKQIAADIADLLVRSLVLAMEREDIETLANSIYRIPKTVEKFAERFVLFRPQMEGIDFTKQLDLMERAARNVLEMVGTMKSGLDLGKTRRLNADIQQIENDADDVLLAFLEALYASDFDPVRRIIINDLFELNEKVVDRCRDAGNTIIHVVLKNS